jgi:hypothetical protein
MRLDTPFLKLPIRFDPDALAAEVRALPESAWSAHPTGFVGNEAVRLVSPGGQQTDEFSGPMGPTKQLELCPYIQEIMGEIGGVWGRSRLMGLAAGGDVPSHIDTHYYWRTHLRLHIPVITNPAVLFTCGDETVHMEAGECWAFDSFRRHRVENKGVEQRIHLVLDTVGGGNLPALIAAAREGTSGAQISGPALREDEFSCCHVTVGIALSSRVSRRACETGSAAGPGFRANGTVRRRLGGCLGGIWNR